MPFPATAGHAGGRGHGALVGGFRAFRPYGRVRPGARLGLGDFGVIDAVLPPALAPTPYVRWNDGIFGLMLLASVGAALLNRVQRV